MILAEQKKQENIIEYILYIWQIEDIIRANNLDINKIDKLIIKDYQVNEQKKQDIKDWYISIINDLKSNNNETSGHCFLTNDLISELNDLHNSLKTSDIKYKEIYSWALSPINEFKEKSKISDNNEVLISLNALYAILLLKLKRKALNPETEHAVKNISNLLGYLALRYKNLKNK